VALLVEGPTGLEVAGLRRALGDPGLEKIPPHITLVPPVNVKQADLPRALGVMREAAASVPGPLELTLGPPASFLPDNPVCYLEVGGDSPALSGLRALRDAVFAGPLQRKLSWPWVPHVTILDGGEPDSISEALSCLSCYRATVSFDRLVLLELGSDRSWKPYADALLGSRVRVAEGGLPVEVIFSRLPDPEALTLDPYVDRQVWAQRGARSLLAPVFASARREGALCGLACAWVDAYGPFVAVWVDPDQRRQGIGTILLGWLETRLRQEGWRFDCLGAHGPAGFYERRSSWCVAVRD
jgi:2'-5' RNA ligase/GNAT superfamily N-acetyltransferase